MSGETLQIFLAAFGVWGVLSAIKAVRAATTGVPYVFGMWDGGLLRVGKRLSLTGARLKIVTTGTLGIGCFLLLARAIPFETGKVVTIVAAIASVVADLVFEDRSA
jgi:hypothetical protein